MKNLTLEDKITLAPALLLPAYLIGRTIATFVFGI